MNKRFGLVLVALATITTLLALSTPSAQAADAYYSAKLSFVLKADQPSVTCTLYNGHSCSSASQFGSIRTDEDANRIWAVVTCTCSVSRGALYYVAKNHPTKGVAWYGGRKALTRYFENVRYHVGHGNIQLLQAAVG